MEMSDTRLGHHNQPVPVFSLWLADSIISTKSVKMQNFVEGMADPSLMRSNRLFQFANTRMHSCSQGSRTTGGKST